MKVVILAGGYGTRLSEETELKPKPMIEIGEKPILWHIMKRYSAYGLNEFIIALGYKGYVIKEYFANYLLHNSDVTVDLNSGKISIHKNDAEPWTVRLINTGLETMTGGRLKRLSNILEGEDFCMTYGDGVGDIDINKLIAFHHEQGKLATVTTVQPPGKFGALTIRNNLVNRFFEKPDGDGGWINGGFFVLSSKVLDYIRDDHTNWEQEPMIRLVQEGNLAAYCHTGFWCPMDTLRDKRYLNELWAANKAPWKV